MVVHNTVNDLNRIDIEYLSFELKARNLRSPPRSKQGFLQSLCSFRNDSFLLTLTFLLIQSSSIEPKCLVQAASLNQLKRIF